MKRSFLLMVLGGIMSMILCTAVISPRSYASGSWTSGTFTFGSKEQITTDQACDYRSVRIGGTFSSKTATICVYDHGGWRYGMYGEALGQQYYTYLVVGIGSDSGMYKITNISSNSSVDIPGSNDLLFNYLTMGFSNNHNLLVIRDFPAHLVRQTTYGETTYEFRDSTTQALIPDGSGNAVTTGAVGVSPNGRFLVAEVMSLGFVTLDTKTGELRLFSNYRHRYGVGGDAHITFVVSNDGRYVAAFDYNIHPVVYTLSSDCVLTASTFAELQNKSQNYRSCPDDGDRLLAAMQTEFGATTMRSMAAHSFNYDDDTLYFHQTEFIDEMHANTYELPLHAGDYKASTNLEYLALGDSYSSGEGDTDGLFGTNHYRADTNKKGPPIEKCHISTRSYPYKLAHLQMIPAEGWQTVACSGAKIQNDYYGLNDGYSGQGKRLQGYPDLTQKKLDALDKFIPGRDKQIEFVKKYKPNAVTVTGSGNDVGFAEILKACVSPFNAEDTCDYADSSYGEYMLSQAIRQQYDNVRSLIYTLKQASPETTVYYVGYPQFLAPGDKVCGGFVSLSRKERSIFRDGVTYLNNIIEAAARSEGAIYVNIEDVLGRHVLCGSSAAYVNGFNADCSDSVFIRFFAGKDDCQESFHPTPAAHLLIASSMNEQIHLADRGVCVADSCKSDVPLSSVIVPQVFKDAYNEEFRANYVPMPGGDELVAQKGNNDGDITMDVPYLEPGSEAHVYMASTPTEIGNFPIDSDGVLHLSFTVPNSISAGYHTLHIEAYTASGEPIDEWWIVRVFGAKGDIDEDGIPDLQDKCEFMPTLGVDKDHDGIDDGCDSFIGTTVANSVSDSNEDTGESASSKLTSGNDKLEASRTVGDGHLGDSGGEGDARGGTKLTNRENGFGNQINWVLLGSASGLVVGVVLFLVMLKSRHGYAKKD